MNRKLKHTCIALLGSGLVLTAALLAGTPADRPAAGSIEIAATEASEEAAARVGAKTARRGLAMPYFSFARGVRRIGG